MSRASNVTTQWLRNCHLDMLVHKVMLIFLCSVLGGHSPEIKWNQVSSMWESKVRDGLRYTEACPVCGNHTAHTLVIPLTVQRVSSHLPLKVVRVTVLKRF